LNRAVSLRIILRDQAGRRRQVEDTSHGDGLVVHHDLVKSFAQFDDLGLRASAALYGARTINGVDCHSHAPRASTLGLCVV
jgi:hypothetical protein